MDLVTMDSAQSVINRAMVETFLDPATRCGTTSLGTDIVDLRSDRLS
jgi:hypothetical protein